MAAELSFSVSSSSEFVALAVGTHQRFKILRCRRQGDPWKSTRQLQRLPFGILGEGANARLLGAALALAAALQVDPVRAESIVVNRGQVNIAFEVTTLGFWRVGGRFEQTAGVINLDRSEPAKSRLRIVADTTSVHTGTESIDQELRSADFFDAERYPEVVFESTSIAFATPATGIVSGTLTMHGLRRLVSLRFRVIAATGSPQATGARLEATGTLRRSLWGMTTDLLVIGDDVRVTIEVSAVPGAPSRAP
jgi:polyisoprenoid-binding protein YceI